VGRTDRAGNPRIEKPIQIVVSPQGGHHGELEDDCPICQMLREQGEAAYTLAEDGQLVEIAHRAPAPAIAVTVVASFLTESVLGDAPQVVEVPVGCVAGDFLAYLWYRWPGLQAFPEGALRLRVNGQAVSPLQVLCGGDVVTVVASQPPRVDLMD